MTVSNNSSVAGPFNGNGATTAFPFSFTAFAPGDVVVVRTDSGANNTILGEDVDYTLSLNSDQDVASGGSITYPISGSPLPVGEKLTAYRDLEFTQLVNIQNQGAYYPEVIEDALDRVTMLTQQLEAAINRIPQLPISTALSSLPMEEPVAGEALHYNAAGNGIESTGIDVASLSTAVAKASSSELNAAASEAGAGTSETNAALSEISAAASLLSTGVLHPQFFAHEASTPNMTIVVEAGRIFPESLITRPQQITPAFVTPVTNPRIDRVALNLNTGAVEVIQGVEGASPVAPDYGVLHYPVCNVVLAPATTSIGNILIEDERALVIPKTGIFTLPAQDLAGLSSVLFDNLPVGIKRLTLTFTAKSSTGNYPLLNIGTSSGIETDFYMSRADNVIGVTSGISVRSGFLAMPGGLLNVSSAFHSGSFKLDSPNSTSWLCVSHCALMATSGGTSIGARSEGYGQKGLYQDINQVSFSINTGTFYSGSAHLTYEF